VLFSGLGSARSRLLAREDKQLVSNRRAKKNPSLSARVSGIT